MANTSLSNWFICNRNINNGKISADLRKARHMEDEKIDTNKPKAGLSYTSKR